MHFNLNIFPLKEEFKLAMPNEENILKANFILNKNFHLSKKNLKIFFPYFIKNYFYQKIINFISNLNLV
jgi:hypothetical protein